MRAKVFFCHIPKCMGTTVLDLLRNNYQVVWSHEELARNGYPAAWSLHYSLRKVDISDMVNAWKQADVLCNESADVVHGHIPLPVIGDTLPGAKRIIFVRDPVGRVISHYAYYRQHGLRGCNLISLHEFANRKCNRNVMTLFVGNSRPDFVGFTNKPKGSVVALAKFLGLEVPDSVDKLNQSTCRINIDDDDIELIHRLNASDIRLYEELVSLYNVYGGYNCL